MSLPLLFQQDLGGAPEVTLALGCTAYIVLFAPPGQSNAPIAVQTHPSIMFRAGEIYADTTEHRPIKVTTLGNNLVTFQDVTFPQAPGDSFTLPLLQARVRLMQAKYVKVQDPS